MGSMSSDQSIAGGDVQELTFGGEQFVVLPKREYRRLLHQEASEPPEPELPPANAQGNYPAVETLKAMIARDIIRERRALGLSQAELARRAGIRVETLNRIERGKFAPSVRTVDKIDRALKERTAEAGQATRPPAPAKVKPSPKRPKTPGRKTKR